MSFNTLTDTLTLLAATLVPIAASVDWQPGASGDAAKQGITFLLTTAGVSAGTLTVLIQGSVNGTTYWSMPNLTAGGPQANAGDGVLAITTTGSFQMQLAGVVPPFLRIVLTPTAGFNGTVAIVAATNTRVS